MENIDNNYIATNTRQKGDSLELAVEHIFNVAGFKTSRNTFIAKYEIDVLAEIGDRSIIIECKNYQNSSLTIRNIVHQWNSKNKIISSHKVIIVITGVSIKPEDHDLASKFDIELWGQEDISDLFNLSLKPDVLRKKLIDKIDFKPLTISERYIEELTYLAIKPLLSNHYIDEEVLYGYFNTFLRSHILTELQMSETSPKERSHYIELFEGSKTKMGFLNLVKKKRKETEYWKRVQNQLQSENLLSSEKQQYYLNHMNELTSEFNAIRAYFTTENYEQKLKKLIATRLRNALHNNQDCKFTTDIKTNCVKVNLIHEDYIAIKVVRVSSAESNILNWIMTSESEPVSNQDGVITSYQWASPSLDDAIEKVYRIFTEYYIASEKAELIDLAIK